MRIAIVTNDNGRGLSRDLEIVSSLARRAGHDPFYVPFQVIPPGTKADLALFLETAPRQAYGIAPKRWLVPNPEWWPQGIGIKEFQRVLCKTHEAERIFSPMTSRAKFLGFTARNRHDASIPRERRFLCVAGNSVAKGADVVVSAWEIHRPPYPLTVVGKLFANHPPVRGVTFTGHVDDAELRRLQNSHLFHLQPSWTEGFGMTTHEALSCGAVVAVPDAPPMNEWAECVVRMPPTDFRRQKSAVAVRVSPTAVQLAVEAMAHLSADAVDDLRTRAFARFDSDRAAFEDRMLGLLARP